jgi:hypothetical protein
MASQHSTYSFDRRLFLAGAGALGPLGGSRAVAQEAARKPDAEAGKQLRQVLAKVHGS